MVPVTRTGRWQPRMAFSTRGSQQGPEDTGSPAPLASAGPSCLLPRFWDPCHRRGPGPGPRGQVGREEDPEGPGPTGASLGPHPERIPKPAGNLHNILCKLISDSDNDLGIEELRRCYNTK